MKYKKSITLILFILIILTYLYLSQYTKILESNVFIQNIILGFIVIIGLYIIILVSSKENTKNSKSGDKLFNLLVKNLDTIYILVSAKNQKIIYLSENVEEILGIKRDNGISTIEKIFNMPIIKNEIKNWNKSQEYVSQMFKYDNPKYNYDMWLRIKIFLNKEKNGEYYIIEIMDATKEHDRQHLLVTQASDIKARESQLHQITQASYDMEININLKTNTYDLKYYKKDDLYFGEERRGKYTEGLKSILEYINENDREEVINNFSLGSLYENFKRYETSSKIVRYRLGNEIKNNTWLESTIFFLSNKQRALVSILTKNVTENAENIRMQNVMLQNAINDLKIMDKSKTKLIQTISHDIRTPLTNIIGFSETLLEKEIDNNIKDDILNINDSSKEVLNIIDGLLDPSKIESKTLEKSETNYNILKTFNRVLRSTREYIQNKPIKINLNLDNNLPIILYGDKIRIKDAITEIVINSIKYTNEGEININVRGEKQDSNVKLIVEVADTGIGISQEKLDEVMNSNNGGISRVKNLMKLLGGAFEIESKEGEYTKVTLEFIQKIVEDNKVRQMLENNKNADIFKLDGKKILVVDDNKLNLKVTKRLLEPFNVDVTLVESGEECIDKVKENSFDLIMLDQMMPGLDGEATLDKLKQIENFSTPIIALTADAMEGQKEKYLSLGFNDYISKPIDKKELSRVLKEYLKDNN